VRAGRADEALAALNDAVDRALSTDEGRRALLAAGRALQGHAFAPGDPVSGDQASDDPTQGVSGDSGSGTTQSSTQALVPRPESSRVRVELVAQFEQPVQVYFVNGIQNTYAEAIAARERLEELLDVEVILIYNHSYRELLDLEITACARALERAGLTGDLIATDQSWSGWLRQKLHNTVTPVLRQACSAADLTAELTTRGMSLAAGVRGLLELAAQRGTGADAASAAVNSRLVPMVEADLAEGHRVVLIGHSQGTMFVRNALGQIREWWKDGAGQRRDGSCDDPGSPQEQAPVGALYISPAFTTFSGMILQRYVSLRGDVLHRLWVTGAAPTAEPNPAQGDSDDLTQAITLHKLLTYLQDGSESLRQITRHFTDLVDELDRTRGLAPCPTAFTPSDTGGDITYTGAFVSISWEVITVTMGENDVNLTVHPDGSADGTYRISWTEDDTYLTEIPAHCIKTFRASGTLTRAAGATQGTISDLVESAPTVDGCKGWDGSYGHSGGTWLLDHITDDTAEGGVDVYANGLAFELRRH
jgi:hypothetical protein